MLPWIDKPCRQPGKTSLWKLTLLMQQQLIECKPDSRRHNREPTMQSLHH
jgi:hypothetical protein